jgi:hypothetical protein
VIAAIFTPPGKPITNEAIKTPQPKDKKPDPSNIRLTDPLSKYPLIDM